MFGVVIWQGFVIAAGPEGTYNRRCVVAATGRDRRHIMRRLAFGLMLAACVVTGCSSSTGPGKNDKPAYPDMEGLVAYYKFNGNLENEVSDLHDGTASGSITYTADRHGSAGRAMYVGTNDKAVVPDDPELDITGGITLAAWVRPEASDRAYAAVIDKKYTEAYSFGIYGGVTDPDTVEMISYISHAGAFTQPLVPMGTGVWSHIAYTFEDASGKGRFYLNGAVVDSSTRASGLATSDEDLYIGGSFLGDGYKGAIDQVAIFNRALTPVEVGELFAFE
jgi:hypothetical protein